MEQTWFLFIWNITFSVVRAQQSDVIVCLVLGLNSPHPRKYLKTIKFLYTTLNTSSKMKENSNPKFLVLTVYKKAFNGTKLKIHLIIGG